MDILMFIDATKVMLISYKVWK